MTRSARPVVLLVGAGHAHLHVAKNARAFGAKGVRLILIDPGNFWYSGMATGMLGGQFAPEADQIDGAALIERAGGEFLADRAHRLRGPDRSLELASGRVLNYDLLSLNVGSDVAMESIPGAAEHGLPVKPLKNLWTVREWVESLPPTPQEPPARVAIVGAGTTGCEVAANLGRLRRACAPRLQITLISGANELMPSAPVRCSRWMRLTLEEAGVETLLASPVERLEDGVVVLRGGRRIAANRILLASGLVASRLVRSLGLPSDSEGSLRVRPTLQSVGDDRVFGAGDCVQIEGHALPRVGVYGVRAAPVLLYNLLAALEQKALRPFRPQSRYLTILNLGNGRGLAMRGSWSAQGRWCLCLKNWLDLRFMARYRAAPVPRLR